MSGAGEHVSETANSLGRINVGARAPGPLPGGAPRLWHGVLHKQEKKRKKRSVESEEGKEYKEEIKMKES